MTRRSKSKWPFGYGVYVYSVESSHYILATLTSDDLDVEAMMLAHDRAVERKQLALTHGNKHPVFIVPLKRHDKPNAFVVPTYKRVPTTANVIKNV